MKINIFKHENPKPPMPLRIQGVKEAPMTPEPDDAEMAAQAILEVMLEKNSKKKQKKSNPGGRIGDRDEKEHEDANNIAYYHHLAEHLRDAYRVARQRSLRFLCFCEQQLDNPKLPTYGHGSVALLEAELYKRLDVVEREGGDMKKRWQNCLAEVTLRLMNAPLPDEDEAATDNTAEPQKDNV